MSDHSFLLADIQLHLETLQAHLKSDPRNKGLLDDFIRQGYGIFRQSDYQVFSSEENTDNFYHKILTEGLIVVVTTGHDEKLDRILPTLIKLQFQRTVLSRFSHPMLKNTVRPVGLFIDEYHRFASEVVGQLTDAEFFSLSGKYGCLSILATQDIMKLKGSHLREHYENVLATMASISYIGAIDNSTKEYLKNSLSSCEGIRVGETRASNSGESQFTYQVGEKTAIPLSILDSLNTGEAIIVGSLNSDRKTDIRFVKFPLFKLD